jgi:large subunit ribosomal protein L31e
MERTYIIPLRKEWLKVPKHRRAKKAINAARQFLQKHMSTENVKLGRHLNMAMWQNGMRNPPHKIEVHVEMVKDSEGDYAYAELAGKDKEILKQIKVEKKEGLAGKLDDFVTGGNKEKIVPKTLAEQKEAEKAEAEKIEKKHPIKKEDPKPVVGTQKSDATKEVKEKNRHEKIVTQDKKEHNSKKN